MIICTSIGFLKTVQEADTEPAIENVTPSEQTAMLSEIDTVQTNGVTQNEMYHIMFLYQIFVFVRQLNIF